MPFSETERNRLTGVQSDVPPPPRGASPLNNNLVPISELCARERSGRLAVTNYSYHQGGECPFERVSELSSLLSSP
jgi:hypothetical protein